MELQEWVDRVFGQAVPLDAPRLIGPEEICGANQATLVRLTEVFEHSASLLKPYPDEALKQAFWDLGSNAFLALKREDIEWALRHRLIRSFETLFREFFAARCQPTLGHLSEEGSPLKLIPSGLA